MDYKAFKQDLTYACKKFQKEGKLLTVDCDNLTINAGRQFVFEGESLNSLEMMVLVKGYIPTSEMLRVYHDSWEEWRRIDTEEEEPEIYEYIFHEYNYVHHQAYNIYISEVIEQQAKIAMSDIYAFMDGLENAYFEGTNEFYNVGVYIREKFQPLGARKEMPAKVIFQPTVAQGKTERKFVIYSFKGDTSIMEVECQTLSQSECPFPSMREGEWAARILAPQALWDKPVNGKQSPSIWCGWAFYDSAEECQAALKASTRASILRSKSKRKLKDPDIVVEVTEEEVTAIMDKVKVIYL